MYYTGGGLSGCCESPGLRGLGIDESERIRRNAIAEQLARKWDNDALNYLRARSRYIPSFEVPAGVPYEPEGGVVTGWATASARTDAAQRHQNVVSYLAWTAPPPPSGTLPPPPPTTEGGVPAPPPSEGPAQPLPKVTVLGAPDQFPLMALAIGAGALWYFTSRKRA